MRDSVGSDVAYALVFLGFIAFMSLPQVGLILDRLADKGALPWQRSTEAGGAVEVYLIHPDMNAIAITSLLVGIAGLCIAVWKIAQKR